MPSPGVSRHALASVARLLLGALGFLLLASYLAIPCFVNDQAVFASTDGPVSCSESHVFRPSVPPAELFRATPPVSEIRFDLPPALAAFALVLAAPLAPHIRDALRRRRQRPFPMSGALMRALPFAPRGDVSTAS